MNNFEAGAHLDTDNNDGNVYDQCLGDLNTDASGLNNQNTSLRNGQPVIDDIGQLGVGGLVTGQNEIGGNTDGAGYATGSRQNIVSGEGGSNSDNDKGEASSPSKVHWQCGEGGSIGKQPATINEVVDIQYANGTTAVQHLETTGRDKVKDGSGSGNANGQFGYDNNKATAGSNNGQGTKGKSKQSYASFFKDNRVPSEASKLKFIAPPLGKLVLGIEEIDSVEAAFGFCLVGYVMGPLPSPYALQNFVKNWGNEVKFTFKGNGWIRFQFPSEEVRDKVLNGGPYMIFGRQLFLKKLSSCFLFGIEDMVFIPSWVQIFGLPADCWTTQALSRIASVVGTPPHTDMLTISKKGATFARILVELDARKPRVREYSVELPTGK